MFKFTREKYKEIKKMDRKTLEEFICDVYKEGLNNGKRKVPTPEKINEIIKNTKGVGEGKRKAIMEEVTKLFE